MKFKRTIFIILIMGIFLTSQPQIWKSNDSLGKEFWENTTLYDQVRSHQISNLSLKQRSYEYSPSRRKKAYFQNKFITDVKSIDDDDYRSLIIEQNGSSKTIFQGNFRISYFEWIDNDRIKVYQGCGSSCMIHYIVNTGNGEFKKFIEKDPFLFR